MAKTTPYAAGDTYVTQERAAIELSKYHVYRGQLAVCPVCDCGPCAPDCAEQALPGRIPADGPHLAPGGPGRAAAFPWTTDATQGASAPHAATGSQDVAF